MRLFIDFDIILDPFGLHFEGILGTLGHKVLDLSSVACSLKKVKNNEDEGGDRVWSMCRP